MLLFIQDKAQQRKQDLEDSLQAQQYFADANEAESWMREKEPIVGNTDYGKDEDSAEVGAPHRPHIILPYHYVRPLSAYFKLGYEWWS